jgi:hypothetical protein
MDYPGWEDNRHCECGLITLDAEWKSRGMRQDLAAELAVQNRLLEGVAH